MTNEHLAIAFLLLLVATPLTWYVIAMVRSEFTPIQWTLRCMCILLVRLLWRTSLPKEVPLTANHGAVVICNHRSSIDPFFVQAAVSRPVHWMVAKEYCEHFAFRAFLRGCAVIPVSRGGVDTAATKAAIRKVSQGGLVGMLPEGRINMTEEFMLPARPGSVLVAIKSNAPIVPCHIEGAPYDRTAWSPLFMPARVRVRFGKPIDLTQYTGRDRESGVVAQAMLKCLRAIACLAGREDFEPSLAGRRWKPSKEELQAHMEASHQRRLQGRQQN